MLAHDVAAPIDVPPFDRSNVDGFALRAADTAGATDATPRRLSLNAEVLACGHAPRLTVAPGTATAIATGGMIPRGADAVVMIEQTELIDAAAPAIDLRRAVSPGAFVSYAGSDIARGETLLRRGATISSREIGMLAACGFESIDVVRRPKVAVLSTGDELAALGAPLRPGAVYDSNGAIIAAAVREAGGEPVAFGAFPDDEVALETAVRAALKQCDIVVLSGGTSKGAGDLSHRIVSRLGAPGVIVHGVALKPGKPLCLGVADGKPIVVLPGFPTSAIFTFHAFVAPVIRAKAGLPPEAAVKVDATVPVRIPSEMGRKEFVLVALVAREDGKVAFPIGKGSGSVTTFSQADGFLEVDALRTSVDPGTAVKVTLIGQARAPDLTIAGSHCIALDAVLSALSAQGITARTIAIGSMGGVTAARRGECDLAPIHLMDPVTGIYNEQYAKDGLALVRGWQRMQGLVFRKGDARFEGKSRPGGAEDRARRSRLHHGEPQRRRRHAYPDRSAAGRSAAARLWQPAALAQCCCCCCCAGPRRLGCGDPVGRRDVWTRLPAALARELRLPAGRQPSRKACRQGVPQCARQSGGARRHRRARHGAGLSYNTAMKSDRNRRLERRGKDHAADARDPAPDRVGPARLDHQARASCL